MGIGEYRHVVTVQFPTTEPDGDGGTVEVWTNRTPPLWNASIRPATVRDLERQTAGTVIATATHVISGRYRPDIAVTDRIVLGIREFRITGIVNPKERGIDVILLAVETL